LDQKNKNVREEIDAEKALYKATEDLKHAKRNLAIIHLEQERIMGEESDLDDQITKFNYALANIEREVKEAQEKVSAASVDISSVSIELESYNQKILDLKLELTAQTASLENNINTLRRLKEFYEDGKKRLVLLTSDITQKKQRQSISNQKIFQSEPKLLRLYDDIKSIEQNIEDNEKDYHVIDDEIRNHDKKINQIKDEREQILQKIRLLEIEHSQLQTKREHISGILTERYQGDLPELEARIKVVPIRCDSYLSMTIEEVEYELGQCRKKIDQIKDVNLGAIKEYEQLKSRYDFLAEQRDDLQKAIDNLHKVIKKINKITQEKFLETFYKINEKLDIVFPRLFEGGSAKLVMTEAENPLETGVEFMIHPPGKKLTRLSLLSGGEKALSAIAFIFSIFLIKPTSFCLMDEIDAPLDDANVFRFNDLLKIIGENSQIIMITHNKKSMEFADSLFGITMEKKGVSKIVSINFQQP
jgi:chromosome segregation protein